MLDKIFGWETPWGRKKREAREHKAWLDMNAKRSQEVADAYRKELKDRAEKAAAAVAVPNPVDTLRAIRREENNRVVAKIREVRSAPGLSAPYGRDPYSSKLSRDEEVNESVSGTLYMIGQLLSPAPSTSDDEAAPDTSFSLPSAPEPDVSRECSISFTDTSSSSDSCDSSYNSSSD